MLSVLRRNVQILCHSTSSGCLLSIQPRSAVILIAQKKKIAAATAHLTSNNYSHKKYTVTAFRGSWIAH